MIRFTKKNTTIVYSKGTTNEEAIEQLSKRVSKRQKEIDKRQWIVDEYNSLLSKQKNDREWIKALERKDIILSGSKANTV